MVQLRELVFLQSCMAATTNQILAIMMDKKFEHLIDVVEYFSWVQYDRGTNTPLSNEQREQLTEVRDKLQNYSNAGECVADLWLECANELLN